MSQRRICVVTSGRADYGLLVEPARAIAATPGLALQLVVTGMHLEAGFGETVREVEADGLEIAARIPLGLADGAAMASAAAVAGFAEVFARLAPDIVLLLGDRYETLAIAQAAMLANVPIGHLSGGDVTEGAFDDAIRHALTKLSHVHFVFHDQAARRVAQLGEAEERIHLVGNPGLDRLATAPTMDRAALEAALGRTLGARNLMVGFHPVTLAADGGLNELAALLAALETLPEDVTLWLSRPNADPGHEAINAALDAWADGRANVEVRAAYGALYPALARACEAVVGNSSSGLAEAPSLGVATVDVGVRQQGRLAGDSVIHAPGEPKAIRAAMDRAMAMDATGAVNPYGDGRASPRIAAVLSALPDRQTLLRKPFRDRAWS